MSKKSVIPGSVPCSLSAPRRNLILAVGPKRHPKASKLTVAIKPAIRQQSCASLTPSTLLAPETPVAAVQVDSWKHKAPSQPSGRIDLDEPGYLRLPQVLKLLGISRSGFYKGVKDGIYPHQVKLSPNPTSRAVGWPKAAIKQLLSDLED